MDKEKIFLMFFIIFAVVAGFVVANGGNIRLDRSCGNYEHKDIMIGERTLSLEIADDECKRVLGLSDRKSLASDNGMLFIFDSEAPQGIWMKRMNFPIDVVWINSAGEIVLLKSNISPSTYPQVFGLEVPSKYVMELPTGSILFNSINLGDMVRIGQI